MFENFSTFRIKTLITIAILLSAFALFPNQCLAQCTDGTQPECECETAPVLCTVDDLDGYMFSMSNYQHPWDGPNPICPGTNTVSNNPTWFAFTAWCTDLDLNVSFDNCVASPGGSIGAQIAIFSDCNYTPVDCNVSGADCNTNDKELNLTGLTIGDVYYFLVDGCAGSYCDITIDVIGTCGDEYIEEWTNPIDGESLVCAGNSETYVVDDLLGAGTFHWYVDGMEIGTSSDPTFTIDWSTTGEFELCVDASNEPCVPESEDPEPLCMTINVYESDAGMLDIDENAVCPGETIEFSVSGYNTNPENEQVLLITDVSGVIIEIISGDAGSFTSDECDKFSICSYNYIDGPGTTPTIGLNVNSIDCETECCDLVCDLITFEDTEDPVFIDPPADETLSCFLELDPVLDLTWTDNCDGTGTVEATETGSSNICDGGVITRTWEYMDACGNRIIHEQEITVGAIEEPAFLNPPPDVTLNCDEVPPTPPTLTYSNAGSGLCLIEGIVDPIVDGTADICGGTITYTWEYIDTCIGLISHVQNITIEPIAIPEFIDPPPHIEVSCNDVPTSAPDLMYTNNGIGGCLVEGSVPAELVGSADICGGMFTFIWEFTDDCGNTITHYQDVVVNPIDPPAFIDAPDDITIACGGVPASPPTLDYSNGASGDCLIAGNVAATTSGTIDDCGGVLTYTWTYTDTCQMTITHVQNITVEPAPLPVFLNPPDDITVSCDAIPTSAGDLSYSNNDTGGCLTEGTVPAVMSGTADNCGGTITFEWSFTDDCGQVLSHVQTVTVDPAPPTEFINPPANITVDCDAIPTSAPDLMYSNNGVGSCLFEGTVPAVMSGSGNICGGNIMFTWTITDPCGDVVTHVQTVTITPAPSPAFVNPPADITVSCDAIPASAPDLMYTNNGTGACLFEGTVSPVLSGSAEACGGLLMYTWNFVSPCGEPINHVQNIVVEPSSPAQFVNPPADITVDCDAIPSTAPDLVYTNGEIGICAIDGSVSAVLNGSPNPCGNSISFIWTYTDPCDNVLEHEQVITINPAPTASFINPPADITVSCANVPANVPNLTYTNGATGICLISGSVAGAQNGNFTYCGGVLLNTWEFTDDCGNTITHSQEITVEPVPAANFINPPADVTVSCNGFPSPLPVLSYNNGESGACQISGTVSPVQSGALDPCGGVIDLTWTFIDDCGREISYTQEYLVEPAPMASFVNPPSDATLNCEDIPTVPPTLSFTNGSSGSCLINGAVQAIQSGSYDVCGGQIQYNWSFTDICNNTISHTQIIDVNPTASPLFIDPPGDEILVCGDNFPDPYFIEYSNGNIGDCEIFGSVLAEQTINDNIATYYWEFTDPCSNEVISHEQTIEISLAPDLVINPEEVHICLGDDFDLSSILVEDLNETSPVISFHTSLPPTDNNELGTPMVSPNQTTTYYIVGTNSFDCENAAPFVLFVDEPASAGIDGEGTICLEEQGVDLFSYLLNVTDFDGEWVDLDGTGVNIGNPYNVHFFGVPEGDYQFQYSITSTNTCPDASAIVQLTVAPVPEITIDSIYCQPGNAFYSVSITVVPEAIVTTNFGMVNANGSAYVISDIPIDQVLTIDATENETLCFDFISINPPDCNCPNVPPALNDGDQTICFGDPIPSLSVTIEDGLIANWYDSPNGGALILGNSLSFLPSETAVGVYTYYVETESISDPGCVSLVRTPVTLTIQALPEANNATLEVCDDDNDGFAIFNLSDAENQINPNPNASFAFYESQNDAENNLNPLSLNFTNTLANSQTIYVLVEESTGCKQIGQVLLQVHAKPGLTLEVIDETCLGDENGSVIIHPNNGQTTNTFSMNGSDWQMDSLFADLTPGNYFAFIQNEFNCLDSLSFEILEGFDLSISEFSITCNDNNTESDPADDFYTIVFNIVNNQGNAGNFEISIDNNSQGAFPYGIVDSIVISADGGTYDLVFEDITSGCSLQQSIGPLNSCSTNCNIQFDELSFVCNDNGTSSFPDDDFYTIYINASSVNGSANNTFNVLVESAFVANFIYGVLDSITLPADGSSPTITIVDNDDIQCTFSSSIGPLIPCSNECVIEIENMLFECDNAGTTDDATDDFYNISFSVSGTNQGPSGMFEVFVNAISNGSYAYGTVVNFTLPADGGNPLISVQDADDSSCSHELEIGPLNSCSTNCTLVLQNLEYDCNDNGTPTDPSDDYYDIEINVSATNGSPDNLYNIVINSVIVATFEYGIQSNFTLPADGSIQNVSITDNTDLACQIQSSIGPLNACSDLCEITAVVSNIICQNGGTQDTDADDVFYFDLVVTGVNTGASWQSTTPALTGVYGQLETFGPYLIVDGDLNITLVDIDDPDCLFQVLVPAPVPCSDPCEIEFSYFEIGDCFDSGTGNTAEDDTFSIQFVVDTILGNTSQYFVQIGTDNYGPYVYGDTITISNFIANGEDYTAVISDDINGSCYAEMTFSQTPCSSCDQTIEAGANQELSCLDPLITLTGSSSETGNYTWTGPNSFLENDISVQVTTAGWYYFEVFFDDGCYQIDSLEVSVDANVPVSDGGPDLTLTCLVDTVSLDGSLSSIGTDIIYEWTDESGMVISNSLIFEIDSAGNYYLQAIDTLNGCSSGLDLVTVGEELDQPAAIIYANPGNTLDCFIEYVILTHEFQPNSIYQWYVNNELVDSEELIINEPSLIVLEVQDTLSGCDDISTLEINDLQEYPLIDLEEASSLDCINTSVTIDGSNSQQNQFILYNWYDENGLISENADLTIMVSNPGWYYFEAMDTVNGCTNIDSIQILDLSELPEIDLMSAYALDCQTDIADINAMVNVDVQDIDVTWSVENGGAILTGSDQLDIQIQGAGLYIIEVINSINNCISYDSILVTEPPIPAFQGIVIDSISCAGEEDGIITIADINGGTEPYEIYINGELTGEEITGLSPGSYIIEVIDANGCQIDSLIELNDGPELSIFLDPIIELTFGEFGTFQAAVNVDSSELNFIQWSPAENLSCDTCLTTFVQGLLSGTYTINVGTASGCDAQASIQLLVNQDINITVPNIFTPNNDGINEGFTIYSDDSIDRVLTMYIFDRWGENVFYQENFEPNKPELGWNGTFKGRPLNPAVFVYMFEILLADGTTRLISGDVTLVR